MTATHWLLIIFIAALVLALSAWALVQLLRDDAPAIRTADARQIHRDVRKLQAQVPSAPRPRHRAGQPATAHSYPPPNLAQVRAQAINAALRDLGKRTTTPNPYRPGSPAHTTWADNYARLFSVDAALQAGSHTKPTPAERA